MHRSGTSITTRWLQHCGLAIGDDLLGKGRSNPQGHFEDVDFLQLNNQILAYNDLTWDLQENKELKFSPYLIQKTRTLIALKANLHKNWGWKDPRNSLLFSHYSKYLDNFLLLYLFRDPKSTVRSLVRRDIYRDYRWYSIDGRLRKAKNFAKHILRQREMTEKYLRTYNIYNETFLKYYDQLKNQRKQCLVITIDTLMKYDVQLLQFLNKNGFSLDINPVSRLLDEKLYHRYKPYPQDDKRYQRAHENYHRLQELEQDSIATLRNL